VIAIKAAGPTQSAAKVSPFLFMAGANTDFIELLKDNIKFQWTSERQRQFERV